MLYMRMETGPDQGTFRYQSGGDTAKNYGCQNELMNLMTALKPNIKNADRKEIVGKLLAQVPKCRPNSDTFLVPCANGVYDEHRRLRGEDPFVSYDDPLFKKEYRDVVFTNKLDTAYNKNASDDLLIKDGFKWSLDRQDGSSGLDAIFGTDQLGATEKQLYLMIAQFVVEFLNRPVAKRMDIARQWLPEKDGAVDISGAFSRKATAGTYKPAVG